MSSYRAASGHDVALGSLTTLDPQPKEEHGGGIQYTRITRVGDGSIVKEGPFFPFEWDEVTASQYSTILSTFGLSSADNANVTVYVRDVDLSTWVRKNGIAHRPIPADAVEWNNRPVNVVVMVTITGDAV